jgi:hypothetical protein
MHRAVTPHDDKKRGAGGYAPTSDGNSALGAGEMNCPTSAQLDGAQDFEEEGKK